MVPFWLLIWVWIANSGSLSVVDLGFGERFLFPFGHCFGVLLQMLVVDSGFIFVIVMGFSCRLWVLVTDFGFWFWTIVIF